MIRHYARNGPLAGYAISSETDADLYSGRTVSVQLPGALEGVTYSFNGEEWEYIGLMPKWPED